MISLPHSVRGLPDTQVFRGCQRLPDTQVFRAAGCQRLGCQTRV